MSVCFLHHVVNYCSFQRNITKLAGNDELTVGIIIKINKNHQRQLTCKKDLIPLRLGVCCCCELLQAFAYRKCMSFLKVPCFCKSDCKIRPYSRDFKKSLSVFMNVRFCFPKQNRNGVQDRNSLFYFRCCEREQSGFSMLHALFNYTNKIWKTYADKKILLQELRENTHTQIKEGNICLLKRKRFWMAAQSDMRQMNVCTAVHV